MSCWIEQRAGHKLVSGEVIRRAKAKWSTADDAVEKRFRTARKRVEDSRLGMERALLFFQVIEGPRRRVRQTLYPASVPSIASREV